MSNPALRVVIACDRDSDESMRRLCDPLVAETDLWLPIDTPAGKPEFRNRYIKTKLRSLIDEPFLILDSDALVRGNLSGILALDCDIAGTRNHSRALFAEQVWEKDRVALEAMGWEIGKHTNTNGIVFFGDTAGAHRLADEWHRHWSESSRSRL